MRRYLIVFIFSMLLPLQKSFSQAYDGAGDEVITVFTDWGRYNFVGLGAHYGLFDFASVGIDFRYAYTTGNWTSLNFVEKMDFRFRVDLHAANILDLEKSDILLGWHTNVKGLHGISATYRYALSDFVLVHGAAHYFYKSPDEAIPSRSVWNFEQSNNQAVEIGFTFRVFQSIGSTPW